MEFVDDDFAQKMVESLRKQCQEDSFTDIELKYQDVVIKGHLNILATKSRFFEDISYGLKHTFELALDTLQHKETFQKVIRYIYSGEIQIHQDNVADILCASKILLIKDLESYCEIFMMSTLDINNCVKYKCLLDTYDLQNGMDDVVHYIDKNIKEVIKTKAAINVSFSDMQNLISDKALQNEYPDDVLDYCVNWVKHNKLERSSYLHVILSDIKLHSCKQSHLLQIHQGNKSLFDKTSADLILDVIYKQNYEKITTTQDAEAMQLFILGGGFKGATGYSANMSCFVSEYRGEMTEYFRLPSGTCYAESSICKFHEKTLIITGGSPTSKMCKLFHITTKDIEDKPSMNHSRCSHQSITVDGNVYAVGGWNDNAKWTDSIECFMQTEWVNKSPMICAIGRPTLAAIDKALYVIGTSQDDETINAQCYDVTTDSWSRINPPPSDIRSALAVTLDDAVYICGGYKKVCVKYKPSTDEWLKLAQTQFVHRWSAGAVLNGFIYIFSGWDGNNNLTEVIEGYDPISNQWKVVDWKLPFGLYRHHAFMMQP